MISPIAAKTVGSKISPSRASTTIIKLSTRLNVASNSSSARRSGLSSPKNIRASDSGGRTVSSLATDTTVRRTANTGQTQRILMMKSATASDDRRCPVKSDPVTVPFSVSVAKAATGS